jgi:hypothetical protein
MFIATFNNVSVFYHTSAVGMGVQDAHALCHFQYSVIYHTIAIGKGFQGITHEPSECPYYSTRVVKD